MQTFIYKWKLGNNEYTGMKDCKDESTLRDCVKNVGGELIEILEVKEAVQMKKKQDKTKTKKCPYCAEEIRIEAIECKYCGKILFNRELAARGTDEAAEEKVKLSGNSYRSPRGSNDGLAITSFILGILSVITSTIGLGFLLAVIAVSLGPGGRDSKYSALANWGIGLGWFVIICYILVLIFWGFIWGALLSGGR